MANKSGMKLEKENKQSTKATESHKRFLTREWQHETCFRKVGLIAMLSMYYNKEILGGDVRKD